jgi:cation diffusion facilitator family transporter
VLHHGDGEQMPMKQNSREHPSSHTHPAADLSIGGTDKGVGAIRRSFFALFAAAVLQLAVALLSGSVSLLVDTLHNFGDAATAGPLWLAFTLERRKPTNRFTYGLGRVEDLAGLFIVLLILSSAIGAAYLSIYRFVHPQQIGYLWAVAAASVTGFFGNEVAARYRIKAGREMGSAALVADGEHGRVDGFASLAVLISAVGTWLGYPIVDAVVGLLMTLLILHLLWESGADIFIRILDGVDPHMVQQIREAAKEARGVKDVSEARVRWLGHRLRAEVNIAVDPQLSVADAHRIAIDVEDRLLKTLHFLSHATIHVDPLTASGDTYHHTGDMDRPL